MAGVNLQKVRERILANQKREEERKKAGSYFKWTVGENRIRILPPWDETGEWAIEAAYHYNVEEKTPLLCPKKTFNKPCPICEEVDLLFKTGSKEDKESAKLISAKTRYFCNILDLNEKDVKERKPKVAPLGVKLFNNLLKIFDDEEYGDYTDPTKGRNLKVTVEGEGLNRSYTPVVSPNKTAVDNFEAIQQLITNLREKVVKEEYTYDKLKGLLDGTETLDAEPNATEEPASTEVAERDEFGDPVKESPKEAAKTPSVEPDKKKEESQKKGLTNTLDRLRAANAKK